VAGAARRSRRGAAPDYYSLYYAENRLNLTIQQILASSPLPDFVIMAGDIVHNPDNSVRKYASMNNGTFNVQGFMASPVVNTVYAKAARAFARFGIPVYATPGNHDSCNFGTTSVANQANCAALLKAYFPTSNAANMNPQDPNPATSLYYSFNYKGWKFISADSTAGQSWNASGTLGGNSNASYGAPQLSWLDAQLTQGMPTVMWTHYPRDFAAVNEAPTLPKPDLSTVIANRCNLMMSMNGHIHMYANWTAQLGFPELSMSATRYDEGAWLMLQFNANPASVSAAQVTILDTGKITQVSLGSNSHVGVWNYGSTVQCVANCSSLVTTNVSFNLAGWPGTAAPPPPPMSTAGVAQLSVVLGGYTTSTFSSAQYTTFATAMASALSVAGGVGNLLQASYINITGVSASTATSVLVSFAVQTFNTAATSSQLASLVSQQQAAFVSTVSTAGLNATKSITLPAAVSPPPAAVSPPPAASSPPPAASATTAAVSGAMTLSGYTSSTFGTGEAAGFKAAVATAAGVQSSAVYITAVANVVSSGRHLLAGGVTVSYTVLVPATANLATVAAGVSGVTTATLQSAGLTQCTAVAVAVAPAPTAIVVGAPPPSDVVTSLPATPAVGTTPAAPASAAPRAALNTLGSALALAVTATMLLAQ
jgi:3',5'-cyclic AMP phosphodiesterase CpdA